MSCPNRWWKWRTFKNVCIRHCNEHRKMPKNYINDCKNLLENIQVNVLKMFSLKQIVFCDMMHYCDWLWGFNPVDLWSLCYSCCLMWAVLQFSGLDVESVLGKELGPLSAYVRLITRKGSLWIGLEEISLWGSKDLNTGSAPSKASSALYRLQKTRSCLC